MLHHFRLYLLKQIDVLELRPSQQIQVVSGLHVKLYNIRLTRPIHVPHNARHHDREAARLTLFKSLAAFECEPVYH